MSNENDFKNDTKALASDHVIEELERKVVASL
jgi:hypothetical protein